MANVSFSVTYGFDAELGDTSAVTEGTSAPGAGDVEVRINSATINQKQLYHALEQIWRFASDPLQSTSVLPIV
jgi:hypothetical protein